MKKFTRFFLPLTLLTIVLSATNSRAQNKTLYLDNIDVCTSGTTVSISLRTKNFTNILGLQGSVGWDTAYLKYSTISYGTNPAILFNSTNMQLTNTAKGNIGFLWFDANLVPETVPDTTILITLKLTVQKSFAGKSVVGIVNSPIPLEIDVPDMTGFPAAATDTATIAGGVNYLAAPVISNVGATLSAVASGTPSSYQWNLNGTPIPFDTAATHVGTIVGGGSYTVTANYANGCSLTSNVLLPISLRQFNGWYNAGTANLSWTSANEVNAANYTVQRSTNGVDYVNVSQLTASGSANGYSYNFADKKAASNTGKLYYRLVIATRDGIKTYSNVILISLNSQAILSVYPNPVKSNLSLQIANTKDENVTLQVVDMLGKVLKQQSAQLYNGINNVSLSVSDLARGNYIIIVKGEKVAQKQFIKD